MSPVLAPPTLAVSDEFRLSAISLPMMVLTATAPPPANAPAVELCDAARLTAEDDDVAVICAAWLAVMLMLPSSAWSVVPAEVYPLGAKPAVASSVLSIMLRAMLTATLVALWGLFPPDDEKLAASLMTG